MLEITCPRCGHRAVSSLEGSTAVCARCNNTYPIPRGYTLLESSFKYAEDARLRRDFSAAQASYTEILKQHPGNAAAHWFRAISRYQVEYQMISQTQYRLVCHQALLDDFGMDADVQKALTLAEGQEKAYYSAEASWISTLQKQVSSYAAVTEPYDVILAVDERNPAALEKARIIRTGVTAAGMRCLCPALDLQAVPRQDWEPYLYHGMTTATAMVYVAVGRSAFPPEPLFDAQRYLSLKAASQREAAGLIQKFIVAFAQLDEYDDIPDELFDGADQRMSMAAPGFLDQLCQLLKGSGADYDTSLRTESGGHDNYAYTNLIRQARLSLESSQFAAAEHSFNEILNYNPRESQAYWGLMLAGLRCADEDALIKKGANIADNSNYRSAIAFANEREAQTYQQVAEAALQTYRMHAAQEAERQRRMQEQAEARARKDAELLRDMQLQKKKKARAKLFRIVCAIVLVIVLIVAGTKIYDFVKARNANEEIYREAMDLYNSGEYYNAKSRFEDLGDYKDSAAMVIACEEEDRMSRFYSAQFQGDDLSSREYAVNIMRGLVDEIPEAQDYLDRWKQEAQDYYDAGEFGNAFLAAKGFGSTSSVFMKLWRTYQSQGLIAASDEGSAMALCNGELRQLNCEHLGIPDGIYQSVDISDSGKSAGLVRQDGTVLLAGEVAGRYDVSSWTDMRTLQINYDLPVGLKKDGTLICAKRGVLAENVIQFDSFKSHIAAVREDGSVYCSFKPLAKAVEGWTDAAQVSIMYVDAFPGETVATLYIVNNDDNLYLVRWEEAEDGITSDGSEPSEGGVVAVVTDSMSVAKLYANGTVRSNRSKSDKAEYDKAFLITLSDAMDIRIRDDMSGYGLNGMDDIHIQMRNFMKGLENVGLAQ